MSQNPPKRTATAWFIIAISAAVMIFIPELVGIDGFEGGFAISFVSLVVAITAVIVGAMYLGWARQVDQIFRGEGILVHWVYPAEFWAQYTKIEYEEEKSEKKGLFLIVSGFALFFGILFWVFDEEAGFIVFLVMLGLIGLVAFAWQFSAWSTYRHNSGVGIKEVYITQNAVYLNKRLYTWKAPFTEFKKVTFAENRKMPLLVFTFTGSSGRAGTQTYNIRVPIPYGQEEVAKELARQINMYN